VDGNASKLSCGQRPAIKKGDNDHTTAPVAVAGRIIPNAENVSGYRKRQAQQMQVQAVMDSSLDAVSRYRSGLKRELYRVIDKLLKMREG
jgi:hypothetical protein